MGLLDKLLGRGKRSHGHDHGQDREHGHEHTPDYNDLQAQEPPAPAAAQPPATATESGAPSAPPTSGSDTAES